MQEYDVFSRIYVIYKIQNKWCILEVWVEFFSRGFLTLKIEFSESSKNAFPLAKTLVFWVHVFMTKIHTNDIQYLEILGKWQNNSTKSQNFEEFWRILRNFGSQDFNIFLKFKNCFSQNCPISSKMMIFLCESVWKKIRPLDWEVFICF